MTGRVIRVVLTAVLFVSTLAATTGRWIHDVVIDEEGWSAAVGDLLEEDPVADEVAAIVTERVGAAAVDEVVDIPFVPGGIEDRVRETIVDRVAPAVRRLMRSQVASEAWRTGVQRSHASVVAVVRDDDTALVGDRRIRIDLSPLAERLVEAVTGAVAGALEFGGVEIDLTPDLDLDLTIVLYDLREADLGLDVADGAERHRTLWLLVAVVSAAAVAIAGPRRGVWTTVAGTTVLAASGAFVLGVRRAQPEGLADTWSHVASTATGYATFTAAIGVGLVLCGAGIRLAGRR